VYLGNISFNKRIKKMRIGGIEMSKCVMCKNENNKGHEFASKDTSGFICNACISWVQTMVIKE